MTSREDEQDLAEVYQLEVEELPASVDQTTTVETDLDLEEVALRSRACTLAGARVDMTPHSPSGHNRNHRNLLSSPDQVRHSTREVVERRYSLA